MHTHTLTHSLTGACHNDESQLVKNARYKVDECVCVCMQMCCVSLTHMLRNKATNLYHSVLYGKYNECYEKSTCPHTFAIQAQLCVCLKAIGTFIKLVVENFLLYKLLLFLYQP